LSGRTPPYEKQHIYRSRTRPDLANSLLSSSLVYDAKAQNVFAEKKIFRKRFFFFEDE
jgi:hypothetical protein